MEMFTGGISPRFAIAVIDHSEETVDFSTRQGILLDASRTVVWTMSWCVPSFVDWDLEVSAGAIVDFSGPRWVEGKGQTGLPDSIWRDQANDVLNLRPLNLNNES